MAEKEKRISKAEGYSEIRKIVEVCNNENKDELLDFIDNELALLESKKERAKELAAKKRAEGDELREQIYSVLTHELQTTEDILPQIEGENITKARITSRLNQLVKDGRVTKDMVKTEDKRRVMAYKLFGEGEEMD